MATPPAKLADASPLAVRAIATLLQRVASAYEAGDFGTIRRQFLNAQLAASMQQEMESWLKEGVHPLRVGVVSLRQSAPRHYIATVEFASDPRAVPSYVIFLFANTPHGLRIADQVTGISGASYQSADWKVTRSAHFAVYHSPYELVGSDRQTLTGLEHQRSLFQSRFGVRLAPVAAYYYYPEQRLIKEMTGGACGRTAEYVGCADVYHGPPAIHTSEWPSYHEPVHVYQLSLEPKPSHGEYWFAPLFIAEGMAVALEDRELDPRLSDYCSDLVYTPLDSCAVQVADTVAPIHLLSDKGFQSGDVGTSYLIGGSFVKYLILHYGYRKFGAFYYALAARPGDKESDYNVATRKAFGRTIRVLLDDWRAALCKGGC